MYQFVDTTESGSDLSLPSEAMSINGTYIENVITGYRTLQVTGRELLESQIEELENGYSDGSRFLNKRRMQRNIIVVYQLLSDSPEDFREKFNELNRLLDQDEATLVFADEPDKHFIGTKSEIRDVDGGLLNVTGEFTMYCTDPFKYGEEVSVSAGTAGSKEVSVQGVCETPCIIELTPSGAITSYTIKGAARDPVTGEAEDIVIKNLSSGKKVIIDGEACTVTEDGANKYADTEMWEFPTLLPGSNTLTFVSSSVPCSVTIKYKPRYEFQQDS